ncbi:MAG: transhydrogenase (AB-specific) [Rickettsiaceae bacterium]|jgi:NAD(P) transhydrogenase subunit alpha|nr:transhydrogenase (AB-specific) [Rickettsiaceae bacterium]
MKILALKETANNEKRVAITPDLVSKYSKLAYQVFVESGAGLQASISDDDYKNAGAEVVSDLSSVISDIDVILKVQAPADDEMKKLSGCKKDAVLIGALNPYQNQQKTESYKNLGIKAFAVELFPRITRAQSMDVLSSQSNLVGYRAVIDAVAELDIAVPMMMTAAGTITPAKVMVLGAGVAGLQAIATAKRLGAVVVAFDVRAVAKEQVQSLGAKFIEVADSSSDGETKAGYAKEMSDEYKKKQEQAIFDNIIKQDIVITTALIPGKPAPKLITEAMIKAMKNGSIIVDIAAVNGGNSELTEPGKVVNKFGVKIIGHDNFPSRVAKDASKLYARNLYNFMELITNKDTKKIDINLEDEIIKSSLITN